MTKRDPVPFNLRRPLPARERIEMYKKEFDPIIEEILGEALSIPVTFNPSEEENYLTNADPQAYREFKGETLEADVPVEMDEETVEDLWLSFYERIQSILAKKPEPTPEIKEQIRMSIMQAVDEARKCSKRDSMTKLLTREPFLEELHTILYHNKVLLNSGHENPDERTLVLYLDIDDFKEINDFFGGRGAGDEVIKQVSKLFKKVFRHNDIKARISGDEFAIIIPDIKEKDIAGILKSKLTQLYQEAPKIEYQGKTKKVTFSIAARSFTQEECKDFTAEQVLLDVDKDSKLIKNTGKGGYIFARKQPNPKMNPDMVEVGRYHPDTGTLTTDRMFRRNLIANGRPNSRSSES